MYINPDTNILFLKDIPLDNTYKNTLYFYNQNDQINYFSNKAKYTCAKMSYQRVNTGTIRVGLKSDNLYECNYLMFQNTSFSDRWFYAFITGVEYVNNETSEVSFEIDVIQTWLFDFEVNQCFVEREHVVDDTRGLHLVPENLEGGEYVYNDMGVAAQFDDWCIVSACTFDGFFEDAEGGLYGGVYSGLQFISYDNVENVNVWLKLVTLNNKSDGIISMFMFPKRFCYGRSDLAPKTYDLTFSSSVTTIDGYKPRNNKLLCAPYNLLYVTNNEGQSANFQWEYFSDTTCTFKLTGGLTCNPEVMLYPSNYKGVENNFNERLLLANFPQCAYNIDTYKAWLASSQTSQAISFINGATSAVVGGTLAMATGGILGTGMALSGVQAVGSTIAQHIDKSTQPPQAKSTGGSITNISNKIKGFQFFTVTIRAEFARIIDDFFDMYGYKIMRVKKPNYTSRPEYNYVKTIDCTISGSIPTDDSAKIESIFNNGVTWWKNPENVGHYDVSNPAPVS